MCYWQGGDFRQIFSVKNCKWGVRKIGGVKSVNMSSDFKGWKEASCPWAILLPLKSYKTKNLAQMLIWKFYLWETPLL